MEHLHWLFKEQKAIQVLTAGFDVIYLSAFPFRRELGWFRLMKGFGSLL
jgi:hypothetical protein